MGLNAPLNRKLRMGLVGGGQGAFIGRVHSHRRRPRQPRRPRRRRPVVRPGQGQGVRPRLRHRARTRLRLLQGDDRRRDEAARRRAHRFRLRRHAEPHALRDRQGVRRGRLQRHVRQAADLRPRPGRGAGQGRRRRPASSSPSRTTTPAIRWSARPARWSRPANWARSTPSAPSTSRAGCAPAWSKAAAQKQAELAHRPEALRRRRLLRRHRHARLQPRPLHHRPAARADFLPAARPSSRAASSTTTAPPSSAIQNGALGTVTASQISHGRENDLWIEVDGTKGVARMAPGGAEQDARPRQRPAAPDLHPRPGGPYLTADGQRLVPAAERPPRGVLRGVRQRLHRRLRRHGPAAPPARSSTAPTASTPTSPTASTA